MSERSSMFDIVAVWIRDSVEQPPTELRALEPAAELGARLAALDAAAPSLTGTDIGDWGTQVSSWRAQVQAVASAAFPNLAHADRYLAAQVLQARFPRCAAILVVFGVMRIDGQGRAYVDFAELWSFLRDPETYATETNWEALFADLGHPMSGRLPAVLAALLVLAPRSIAALVHDSLRFGRPPMTSISEGSPAERAAWQELRERTSDWIAFTLPIKFSEPVVDSLSWAAGYQPDMGASLAFRSNARGPSAGNPSHVEFEAWLALGLERAEWRWDFYDRWTLLVRPGISAGFGKGIAANETTPSWHGAFRALSMGTTQLPSENDPLIVRLFREMPPGEDDISIGPAYDTHFRIRDVALQLELRQGDPVFRVVLECRDLKLALAPRLFRSLGRPAGLLREGMFFDLDAVFSWGVGEGVNLNLESSLDVYFFIDYRLGSDEFNFKLHGIRCRLEGAVALDDGELTAGGGRLIVTTHVSTRLGPIGLVIDGIGLWGGYWPPAVDAEKTYIEFIPPTGAGLTLHVPGFEGGGFVDFTGGPSNRYAGVLWIRVFDMFEVRAWGVHEDTASGKTSFIAILGVDFSPGIAIGYGFYIIGFGGLVAINRRFDTDALRFRLTSGAAGNVLFNSDPIANAPIVLSDLDALFPRADGVHVAGPTMRVTWLYLVDFDVGLFFEVTEGSSPGAAPTITKVVLLGSARCKLELLDFKLIDIQLDLGGFIDTVERVIEFDAALVHSTILELFTLTGDAAFRLGFGDRPYAMLTLGGFHPAYQVPSYVQFPELARLGVVVEIDVGVELMFRTEQYLAVTTNTIQFGQKIELELDAGAVEVHGWIGFDVLIQFKPFYFSVDIYAGFRVKVIGLTLAGVKLRGTLSGPGPITLAARFCIELLFFDICWSDSIDIGAAVTQAIESVASLVRALAEELADVANLAAIGGAGSNNFVVAGQALVADGQAVVSPTGGLAWTQRRAPLDTLIERFEGAPLASGPQAVVLEVGQGGQVGQGEGEVVRDHFAPGSFATLSESEALNRAAFERLPAGSTIGFGVEASGHQACNLGWKQYVLPDTQASEETFVAAVPALVLAAMHERSTPTKMFVRKSTMLGVRDPAWAVTASDGGVVAEGLSQTDAHQRARHHGGTALPEGDVVAVGGL